MSMEIDSYAELLGYRSLTFVGLSPELRHALRKAGFTTDGDGRTCAVKW